MPTEQPNMNELIDSSRVGEVLRDGVEWNSIGDGVEWSDGWNEGSKEGRPAIEIAPGSPVIEQVKDLSDKITTDQPVSRGDLDSIKESLLSTQVKIGSKEFTLGELKSFGEGICEFLLSLPKQYAVAYASLKDSGVLETSLSSQTDSPSLRGAEGDEATSLSSQAKRSNLETQEQLKGITGVDGNFYPIPSLDIITEMITKSPETIEKYNLKLQQGFKVLNLVPFAMPIGTDIKTTRQVNDGNQDGGGESEQEGDDQQDDNQQAETTVEYHEYTGLLKAYTETLRDLAQSETFHYQGTTKPKPKGKVLAEGANPDSPFTNKDAWVEVDLNYPLYAWDQILNSDLPESTNPLYYYPQSFETNTTNPDDSTQYPGLTKPEILRQAIADQARNESAQAQDDNVQVPDGRERQAELVSASRNSLTSGWEITLNQASTLIPNKGEGKTLHNRKQLEAGLSSKQYLNLLQTDPQYSHESGMTIEQALTQAIQKLHTQGEVINDYCNWDKERSGEGSGKINFLIGNFLQDRVPGWRWRRSSVYRRALLYGGGPDYPDSRCGVLSAVRAIP